MTDYNYMAGTFPKVKDVQAVHSTSKLSGILYWFPRLEIPLLVLPWEPERNSAKESPKGTFMRNLCGILWRSFHRIHIYDRSQEWARVRNLHMHLYKFVLQDRMSPQIAYDGSCRSFLLNEPNGQNE